MPSGQVLSTQCCQRVQPLGQRRWDGFPFGLGKMSSTDRSSSLGGSRSLTASMSSTSTSCLVPMQSSSLWPQASCYSCLWVSLPLSRGLLIRGRVSGRLATHPSVLPFHTPALAVICLEAACPQLSLGFSCSSLKATGGHPSGPAEIQALGQGGQPPLSCPALSSSSLFTPQPRPLLSPLHLLLLLWVGDCLPHDGVLSSSTGAALGKCWKSDSEDGGWDGVLLGRRADV